MLVVNVNESSATYAARKAATDLASSIGFSETEIGKVAIVVTEMATNLLKHAGSGQILVSADAASLEILAIDSGPGMADTRACLRDGYSTAGSNGTGLGAISRLSSESEIYSVPGHGTIVRARCGPSQDQNRPLPLEVAGVSVAFPGETDCGDAFTFRQSGDETHFLVADGLGHGSGAAEAAQTAVTALHRTSQTDVIELMQIMHTALRGTRGAAVAIVSLNPVLGRVRFCGSGNISGTLVDAGEVRHCVSMHGIVGHQIRTPRAFDYDWHPRTLLVLASDGISNHWDIRSMPGVLQQSALVVAGAIYRAARRRNDDATVLVAKAGQFT